MRNKPVAKIPSLASHPMAAMLSASQEKRKPRLPEDQWLITAHLPRMLGLLLQAQQ